MRSMSVTRRQREVLDFISNFVQRSGSGGKNPRDFTLDPSEKWLVAANQDTQNIAVFERHPHDGRLKLTDRSYHVGAPVAVLFV